MESWRHDFEGPALQYAVLGERFARNAFYLRRNLRKRRIARESLNSGSVPLSVSGTIQLEGDHRFSRTVGVYLISGDHGHYQISWEESLSRDEKSEPSFSFQCALNLERSATQSADSMFFLLMVGRPRKLDSANMRTIVEQFCSKCSSQDDAMAEDKRGAVSSVMQSIRIPRHHILIDLHQHLKRAQRLLLTIPKQEQRQSPFRFFAQPFADRSTPTAVILHERSCCHMFSILPPPPESETLHGTLSISLNTKQTEPLPRPQVEDKSVERFLVYHFCAPQQHQALPSSVSALLPSSSSSSFETQQPSLSGAEWVVRQQVLRHLTCPWCGDCFRSSTASSPLLKIHKDTNTLTDSARADLMMLLQHLSCHHDAYRLELGQDNFGNLHIVFRREPRDPSVISLQKTFYLIGRDYVGPTYRIQHVTLPSVDMSTATAAAGGNAGVSAVNTNGQKKVVAKPGTNGGSKGSNGNGGQSSSSGKIDMRLQPATVLGKRHRTQYYHTTSGEALSTAEIGYDSDDAVDSSFELLRRNDALVEFSDITMQEKQFFQLWNSHLATFPPHGDRFIPLICERFLQRFMPILVQGTMRFNLLLHLVNLWDFGLLLSEEVEHYMRRVDACALERKSTAVSLAVSESVMEDEDD